VAKLVACANVKGGVGKTTVSVALAECFAHVGLANTIVVDIDPQINASITLSGDLPADATPWANDRTIVSYLTMVKDGLRPDANLFSHVVRKMGRRTVSYISGDPRIVRFERQQLATPGETLWSASGWFLGAIDAMVEALRPHYGIILFDCPPGISLICEAVLHRADLIVVPVSPTRLATQGIEAYHSYLSDDVRIGNLREKSVILKNKIANDRVSGEFVDLINGLRGTYNVLDAEWNERVALKRAMDRRRDDLTMLTRLRRLQWFEQTYGGEAETVIATTNELWSEHLMRGETP
jgi:chromosome partitioning protein